MFVLSFQDCLLYVCILDFFGAGMALHTRQSWRNPKRSSGRDRNSEKISIMLKVFRGVAMCSWVRS
jgi:hypothetical protein